MSKIYTFSGYFTLFFDLKNMLTGAGGAAQWVKCFLCTQKDLSLYPQHQVKNQALHAPKSLVLKGDLLQSDPRNCWPAGLAKTVISLFLGLVGDSISKNNLDTNSGRKLRSVPSFYTHLNIQAHMNMYTYAQTYSTLTCTCTQMNMYIQRQQCMHIYTHVHIHEHVHTNTCTYSNRFTQPCSEELYVGRQKN